MKPFYRRRFLNKRGHHGGAYVIADVEIERSEHQGQVYPPTVFGSLNVSDCSRSAQLDFTIDRAGQVDNALHKARLLRDTVVEFTAALEQAVDEVRGELQRD